jgi:hypothetical protein
LFVCRHTAFDAITGPALFDVLVDKWRLAILRLVDLTAIGLLVVKFGSPLADTWLGNRLGQLGRASLEVFSAHVCFCFIFLALGNGTEFPFTVWQDVLLLLTTLSGLFAVAWLQNSHRQHISG